MISKLMIGLTLLVCSSLVHAQGSDSDAVNAEALQQQLEQARQDLAEAAQRMARLQRELVQSEGGAQAWTWKSEHGQLQEIDLDIHVDPERIRHIALAGFPPRLGVLLGDPTSADGNRIIGVTPGSGAEQAGLRQDDRLISVDGQDVTVETSTRIRELLANHKSGDSVDVTIRRGDGNELVMPVTLSSALQEISMLGERLGPMMQNIEQHIIHIGAHDELPAPPMPPMPPMPPSMGGLGRDTHLINNHAGLAPYFGTDQGVLVLRIAGDNSLNLESGDVVLHVDGEPVNRPVDLGRALLGREAGDEVTLEVMRQGVMTSVYGTISEQIRPESGTRRIEIHRQRREPEGA